MTGRGGRLHAKKILEIALDDDWAGSIGRECKVVGKFGTVLRSPRYWHVSLFMFYCRVKLFVVGRI